MSHLKNDLVDRKTINFHFEFVERNINLRQGDPGKKIFELILKTFEKFPHKSFIN